jgi:putative transposase
MGTKSSAVYEINYHIVWVTKYRKQLLKDELRDFLSDQLKTIAEAKEWTIIDMEIMPEHIHMFISAPPFIAPTDIVKVLKGVSSKRMFEKYPILREKEYWGGHLWSSSYYVGTAGHVSAETIKKYIDGTKNRKALRNSSTV